MTDDQLALDHFGDNAGADDADSDDYDPSFTAEDPLGEPLPFQTSDQITVQSPLDAHPLPPKPTAQLGSLTPLDSAQTTPATTFNPPKMRGGFEVDEDDSDAEEENTKDTPQIYESADGAEGHDAVFTPSDVPVDSPPSAKKANGVALTAQSQDASNSASTAVSSAALLTSTASPQRAATVTPVPATVDTPVQTSSAPENVTNHLAPALSKGRLAHDVVGILQDRIEDDPRGDIEAWLALIEEYKSRNKQDDVRKTYDDFLNVFPICVSLLFAANHNILLTFQRLSSGAHTFAGRNSMITSSRWKISSRDPFWRTPMWSYGLSILVMFADGTAWLLVTSIRRTKSLTMLSNSP